MKNYFTGSKIELYPSNVFPMIGRHEYKFVFYVSENKLKNTKLTVFINLNKSSL